MFSLNLALPRILNFDSSNYELSWLFFCIVTKRSFLIPLNENQGKRRGGQDDRYFIEM
jgi:hypothetical protein